MHPIVKMYLGEDEFENLKDEFVNDPNPTARAISLCIKALYDKSLRENILKICEEYYTYAEKDKLLSVIFLDRWLRLCVFVGRPQDCETILSRIKKIDLSDQVEEFQVIPMACEAIWCGVTKNLTRFVDIATQICEKLPITSPKYGRSFIRLCLPESRRGRLDKYRKRLKSIIDNGQSPLITKNYIVLEYFNLIEQCEMAEAEKLLPKITTLKWMRGLEESSKYALLHLNLLKAYYSDAFFQEDFEATDKPPLFIASCYLLKRQPEKAYQELHNLSKQVLAFSDSSFFSYAQIRIELSNRNADAAKWFLNERQKAGSISDIDNFFLARVELIKQNLNKAKYYLKKLRSGVIKYGLQKRLDFEVDLSCELVSNYFYKLYEECELLETSTIEISPPQINDNKTHMIGHSKESQLIMNQIEKLSKIDLPILIVGETGTGKELVAKSLHEKSDRSAEPFVAINCGAVSDSLLQSELFGYEKGAFTGAMSYHKGIFEDAGTGTVFLDEIGEISQQLQVALLRLLESGEYRPVGGSRPKKITCKIIAATNAPLNQMVDTGAFRRDLLYRLERLKLNLPALRDRKDDIEELTMHFIKQINSNPSVQISKDLVVALKWNKWPGNIRELRNVIERMVLLNSNKSFYTAQDLEKPYIPPDEYLAMQDKSGFYPAVSIEEKEPPQSKKADPFENISIKNTWENANFLEVETMPSHRRVELLKRLFKTYKKLNRAETAKALKVAPNTAAADLKILMDEGLIEKIMPSKSPRSHYFKWIGED